MHFPAPLASAIRATILQFICPLFLDIGLFTRTSALLLTAVSSAAVLQNFVANRDPHLAILYTLIMVTLVFTGGASSPSTLDCLLEDSL